MVLQVFAAFFYLCINKSMCNKNNIMRLNNSELSVYRALDKKCDISNWAYVMQNQHSDKYHTEVDWILKSRHIHDKTLFPVFQFPLWLILKYNSPVSVQQEQDGHHLLVFCTNTFFNIFSRLLRVFSSCLHNLGCIKNYHTKVSNDSLIILKKA